MSEQPDPIDPSSIDDGPIDRTGQILAVVLLVAMLGFNLFGDRTDKPWKSWTEPVTEFVTDLLPEGWGEDDDEGEDKDDKARLKGATKPGAKKVSVEKPKVQKPVAQEEEGGPEGER